MLQCHFRAGHLKGILKSKCLSNHVQALYDSLENSNYFWVELHGFSGLAVGLRKILFPPPARITEMTVAHMYGRLFI